MKAAVSRDILARAFFVDLAENAGQVIGDRYTKSVLGDHAPTY